MCSVGYDMILADTFGTCFLWSVVLLVTIYYRDLRAIHRARKIDPPRNQGVCYVFVQRRGRVRSFVTEDSLSKSCTCLFGCTRTSAIMCNHASCSSNNLACEVCPTRLLGLGGFGSSQKASCCK